MGRTYSGVLGYLAAALTLVRGAITGAGVEGTMLSTIAALATFAVVGFVIGMIAENTVNQSVRQRIEAQLAATHSSKAT